MAKEKEEWECLRYIHFVLTLTLDISQANTPPKETPPSADTIFDSKAEDFILTLLQYVLMTLTGLSSSSAPRLGSLFVRQCLAFATWNGMGFHARNRRALHTVEMQESDLKHLKVNQGRLMKALHYTCEFGTGKRWGRYVDRSTAAPHILSMASSKPE